MGTGARSIQQSDFPQGGRRPHGKTDRTPRPADKSAQDARQTDRAGGQADRAQQILRDGDPRADAAAFAGAVVVRLPGRFKDGEQSGQHQKTDQKPCGCTAGSGHVRLPPLEFANHSQISIPSGRGNVKQKLRAAPHTLILRCSRHSFFAPFLDRSGELCYNGMRKKIRKRRDYFA